jgi:phosphate:Na+ symporter
VFDRILSCVGRTSEEDIEDFSVPRYLDRKLVGNLASAVPAVQHETQRHLKAGAMFLGSAKGDKTAPSDPGEHYLATDILNRDIRSYSASMFRDDMPTAEMDLVASLIEEADFSASLAESLHQIARRVKREKFGIEGQKFVDEALNRVGHSLDVILVDASMPETVLPAGHHKAGDIEDIRWRLLQQGPAVPAGERGAILAILGSIERAELLISRIDAERRSVDRNVAAQKTVQATHRKGRDKDFSGGMSPVPAE